MAKPNEIARVRQKLIVDTNKTLVVIKLNENENEQVIFDTINSTGVKLTASDVIKNALFQKIRQPGGVLERFYTETWQKSFEENEEAQAEWLDTRGIGQNQRTHIDLFFYSFAIIEGFFRVPGDTITNLAERYKEHIRNISIEDTKSFIRKICDYAEAYRDTFIEFGDIKEYKYSDARNRLLQILNTIKITAFDPFILFAVKNYDENRQKELFQKLECYVMRHYIIGNTSKMGSFLSDAVEMIEGSFDFEEKLADTLISDQRLDNSLKYVNNTKAKLLLFWVELHRHIRKESDLHNGSLSYTFDLEHIMPQKWDEYWKVDVLPVLDENGEPVPDELAEQTRKQAVYEIGNMTLLSSKLNRKLQNFSFEAKVNGAVIDKKPRPGMKEFASLSITKEVIGRDPLVWNEAGIHERTEKLSAEIKLLWPCTKRNVNRTA